MKRHAALLVASLLLAAPAHAIEAVDQGYSFAFVPAPPRAGEPLRLSVVGRPGRCTPLPAEMPASLEGRVLKIKLFGSDACEPNVPAEEGLYPLPTLPSTGAYRMRLLTCGFQPTDSAPDGCSLVLEHGFTVYDANARVPSIPAMTPFAAFAFAVIAIGSGLGAWRRMR